MNIKELKGIGKKTEELFNRFCVYTVEDLVEFYPRDYDVYEEPVFVNTLADAEDKKIVSIDGMVVKRAEMYRTGKLQIVSGVISDPKGDRIKCTWFNMPFLVSTLKQGMHYVFRGYVTKKNGQLVMEQPKMYTMAEYQKLCMSMQPIYPLTKGLSNNVVIKAVKQALEKYKTGLDMEYIPDDVRNRYTLAEHNFAVVNIHFPASVNDYLAARKRLAFEEFFLFILAVRNLKENNVRRPNGYVIENDKKTDEFIDRLEFNLTNAQSAAWDEIKKNMSGTGLMNRLIQGDVGSGKTIVAVLTLMNTAFAGFQGAIMVPTEVLARQQYQSIMSLFEKHGIDLNVELLTGSMTAAQKRNAYENIKTGKTDIIVGTHALIQEKVEYKNLALVITDEQHRFGVNQRKDFSLKGSDPHVLVMSATPIPRTLAIIIYGDMDISVIDELPSNRVPIKNCVVDTGYRPNAYHFIEKQVSQGRQAYVICPMVEENENVEAENVIDYTERLRHEFKNAVRVEYLHGKMKPGEKNRIMEQFSSGEIDVLVSTTVVEVGVNVPNATVMMVENANRFGLAQLHQLRGRVGRGSFQSYCIFVSDSKSKETKKRLEILNSSNDGFKIAEEDLKLRGPGDFLGVRQSGDFEFKVGNVFSDAKVLKQASEAADVILAEDPLLEKKENVKLRKKVSEYTQMCLNQLNI